MFMLGYKRKIQISFWNKNTKKKKVQIYIHFHDVPYGKYSETVWNVLLKEASNSYGT